MMFEQMLPRTDSDSSGFSVFKGLLILMSVCGVGFVSLSDTHKSEDMGGQRKLQGDVIALISAAFYGAYLVFLEKKIGNEERCNMMMFFGFVGLCNIVLLSPVCIVMQILSSEAFVWPAARPFMYLCLNAIVGTVLSDYLWIYSTLLTSPLVATLGLSLTIPTAVMVDYLWGNVEIDSGFMLGMGLVLIAFVGINLASYMPLLKWLYEWVRSCAGVKVAYILLGYKPDASENMPTIHEV
ncbi:hypothetical protein SARC_05139 [Sphaeroforma arctica JP610]|uniref:Uncharacterized protein n=1 Tax=Sphaeroforma arctica JP610 TaxID=667725 RepID=A0A0L0G0J2_9EUKA|nr:hypothetical protein SARC_05139 [Sphaeroforma arctica JP610]KNC82565.1 hypothetical protein SARC_05139 [Sphaeroforma arctica JP610]|eukprot:XP_014156467.1 hypothetical protein SARC_05139 [Sphaeroforma arctica JP610]